MQKVICSRLIASAGETSLMTMMFETWRGTYLQLSGESARHKPPIQYFPCGSINTTRAAIRAFCQTNLSNPHLEEEGWTAQSASLETCEPFKDNDCVATLAHPFLSHAVTRIEAQLHGRLFNEMLPISPMYRAAKSSTKMSLVDVPWRGLPGTMDLEKGYFLSWNGQAYRFPARIIETGINLQLVGYIEGEQFYIISGLSKNEPLDETGLEAASQFFAPGTVSIAPTVMCVSANVFDPNLAYVDPTIRTAMRICAVSYKHRKPDLNLILRDFLALL